MATKPRNWKQEYKTAVARGEDRDQIERQRARRALDKKGVARKGKDIDHIKPLRAGGKSTDGNLRLRSPSNNRSDNGHEPGE
jgi:hypothetical protein